MSFRASFCHPFQPDIIEMGEVSPAQIAEFFNQIPWLDFLQKMESQQPDEIYFSPSLEVENQQTRHGVSISIAGTAAEHEFYLFYKRPKHRRYLLGLFSATDAAYTTEVHRQTHQQAALVLEDLLSHNYAALEQKIG